MIPKLKEVVYLVVGQKIAELRGEKNVSLDELAKKSKIEAQTLSYAEVGRIKLSLVQLIEIALALNVELDALLPKVSKSLLKDGEAFARETVAAMLQNMGK